MAWTQPLASSKADGPTSITTGALEFNSGLCLHDQHDSDFSQNRLKNQILCSGYSPVQLSSSR